VPPPEAGVELSMQDFVVGQMDCHSQFMIPQKLYGREVEVLQLMTAYDRATHGKKEAIFVRGYSGIGKSSIVNEVHKVNIVYFFFLKPKKDKPNLPFLFICLLADCTKWWIFYWWQV